ncbi:efflux RND transporter periplasmic adaptor subunit [Roseateles sp. DB2]
MQREQLLSQLRIEREPPRAGHSIFRIWKLGIAVVAGAGLLSAGAYAMLSRPQQVQVMRAVHVPVSASSESAVLEASGYVIARRQATVSSKITGKVKKVLIEEGQIVQAGDIMALLDPTDAEDQRGLAASQLAAVESQVAGIAAQLLEAEANVRRLGELADHRMVSRASLDQASAQRDSLRAQLTTAERNVLVSRMQLKATETALESTIIRAPFTGVVIAKAAQPGEIVSPLSAGGGFTRTGIGTIVDMHSLLVEVDVGEAYIGRVKPGMPVQSTLNAYSGWRIPGEVVHIVPTADRGKATVKVRVALHVQDPRVMPDMGAKVSFFEGKDKDPVQSQSVNAVSQSIVPKLSIREQGSQSYAFVAVQKKSGYELEKRFIEVKNAIDQRWLVRDGIGSGDLVVVDPDVSLRNGQRVRVTLLNAVGEN